jgi:hypothetical protein
MKIRIQVICGCGATNYELKDWIAHFKYNSFWRAVYYLMLTKIIITRNFRS